jgi:ferric-dicitrate binding protein FerR (iron transport regulator)
MNKNELQQLAQKYLDGTATEEEKQQLNQWYDNNTGDELPEIINIQTPETEEQIKQRLFNKIHQNMTVKSDIGSMDGKHSFSVKRLIIQVASVAAVFLVAFMIWYSRGNQPVAEKQLVNVPSNRIISIMLPDSSRVWLNAGSVFKYPKKFVGKLREVELLEGRAFFDVKHTAGHPFIVKTKNLNVTVLGTSFDVRSYQREGTTKVSVVTGKVGITLPNKPGNPAIMLLPKQEVVLSKITNHVIKEATREAVVNLWCKNVLVFEQEDLGNVFKALEKKYNTKITVEDKELLNERISITLGNQRLDTIMEILSFTKHFNYKMANDSTVIIK